MGEETRALAIAAPAPAPAAPAPPAPAPPAAASGSGWRESLLPFVVVSVTYLIFTMTDGAVRMVVLLHAFEQSFSALEVAIMFSLYEFMGVVTNLLAGIAGSRWGIKATLLTGLGFQLAGLGMLFGWQDSWSKGEAIVFTTFAQMLCGIAKDLTKLGGKTVAKLVTPTDKQNRLFKLVSLITGWKNSLKGVGYFIGAAFVSISYFTALGVLCGMIVVAIPWPLFALKSDLGRVAKKNITLSAVFQKNYNVSVLSLARAFLFGSRDLWFEIPLPFFLRDSAIGLGWPRPAVGAFLACWIIIYGQIQSWTPQLVLKPLRQSPPNKLHSLLWVLLLLPSTTVMAGFLQDSAIFSDRDQGAMVAVLVVVLVVFAVVFAVNSAIHSYLIVKYCEGNKVAMDVGFYYMSNAAGRLVGTMLSGVLYTYAGDSVREGFAACFWVSVAFISITAFVTIFINDNETGLFCGSCMCVSPRPEPALPKNESKTAILENSV